MSPCETILYSKVMKDFADQNSAHLLDDVIVCPQCDAVYRMKKPGHGERAVCQRCHKVLIAPRRNAGLHIIAVAMAVSRLVEDHAETLVELDINPLIVKTKGAIAADAMARLKEIG